MDLTNKGFTDNFNQFQWINGGRNLIGVECEINEKREVNNSFVKLGYKKEELGQWESTI